MKKYIVYALIFPALVMLSCSDADPEIIEEVIVESFEYSSNTAEAFDTAVPEMHWDSIQAATFIKFDNTDLKIRLNFKGRTAGVYTAADAIFYKYSYDANQSQSIDIVCDTNTGIEVTVDNYGAIGEYIEGSFSADNCDGLAQTNEVTGTFKVLREE